MRSIAEAIQSLQSASAESAAYLAFHRRRYSYLIGVLTALLPETTIAPKILDIGLSYQTLLLAELFPAAVLDTMGFDDSRFAPAGRRAHIEFDLNRAADAADWPHAGPYDVIVMAEVIEHLHAAPVRVLRMLASLLGPGGTLVLQTPNPVSLVRRVSLLLGKSPFEVIREDSRNPGHFCEYTVQDLRWLAGKAELEVTGVALKNYFGKRNPVHDAACAALPGPLPEGITMLLRRPHS